jgi:uncharacterized protein YhfF
MERARRGASKEHKEQARREGRGERSHKKWRQQEVEAVLCIQV